jgi:hypothetical protein
MKALAKASRVNTALQVIQRMNNGMTIVDACRKVGVPRSTFYDICKRNPEAVAKVQEIIEANAQQQLGLILSHKTEILQKVISDGLADTTKPKDRLAIYMTLNELVDGLTQSLEIDNNLEREAAEFLSRGPTLRNATSRLTATETTITIESEI